MRARRLLGLAVLMLAPEAWAQDDARAREPAEKEPDVFATRPGYAQVQLSAFFGDGVRFNNPYRLATPLGSSAESISRSASYVDVGAAGLLGDPLGLQHGVALRLGVAVEGIRQAVMTPSYVLWRRWRALAAYGRLGLPIVLTPQPTFGFEAGAGGVWFFRGGFGLAAEIVGDVFYGAGTREKATVTYPMLSGQLGLLVAYEVLP
jgi:hypothetical protein